MKIRLLLLTLLFGTAAAEAAPPECAMPGGYEYSRQTLSLSVPPVNEICPSYVVFTRELEKLELNFAAVDGFDFLIVGRGGSVASRFGHAMLSMRLKNGQAVDVGFAAQTMNEPINVLKGLDGRYPSLLSFTSELETLKRNLYIDLRDVTRFPLTLTEDQQRLLWAELIEQYWTYAGKYKFLVNNCASELLRLLKTLVPYGHSLQRVSGKYLTPNKLLHELIETGLADGQRLSTAASQKRTLESYLRDFSRTRRPRYLSLKSFAKTPAAARRRWLNVPNLSATERMRAHLLETQALHSQIKAFNRAALKFAEDKAPETIARVHETLSAMSIAHLRRANVLGAPTADSTVTEDELHTMNSSYQWALLEVRSKTSSQPELAQQWLEIERTREGLKSIR